MFRCQLEFAGDTFSKGMRLGRTRLSSEFLLDDWCMLVTSHSLCGSEWMSDVENGMSEVLARRPSTLANWWVAELPPETKDHWFVCSSSVRPSLCRWRPHRGRVLVPVEWLIYRSRVVDSPPATGVPWYNLASVDGDDPNHSDVWQFDSWSALGVVCKVEPGKWLWSPLGCALSGCELFVVFVPDVSITAGWSDEGLAACHPADGLSWCEYPVRNLGDEEPETGPTLTRWCSLANLIPAVCLQWSRCVVPSPGKSCPWRSNRPDKPDPNPLRRSPGQNWPCYLCKEPWIEE